MKLSYSTLVLASTAFCATAAFAANQARVNVPFNFTAKGQSFPAGSYAISLNADYNIVTMENQTEPGKHISWIVGPTDPGKAPALVTFDETGSDYALKSIQLGMRVTPNLDTHQKHGISATTSISGD